MRNTTTEEQKTKARKFTSVIVKALSEHGFDTEKRKIIIKDVVKFKLSPAGFIEVEGIEIDQFGPNPKINSILIEGTELVIKASAAGFEGEERFDIAEWF